LFWQKHRAFAISNAYYSDALKTKEAKADVELRGTLELAIGLNHLRQNDWKNTHKVLERLLKECPDVPNQDQALLALIAAHLGLEQREDALKTLEQLRSRFPSSQAVGSGEQLIQQAQRTGAR
jgi:outer membrane protein assembly factor BamD (BamD/ComL family)